MAMIKACILEPYVFCGVAWDHETVRLADCEVLCIGLSRIIDDEFVAQCPHLRYIVSPTTAIDHIRISNDEIKIIYLDSDEINHIKASSEFALFLILALLKRAPRIFQGERLVGEDLDGKKLGVLGCGRIGSAVGRYAAVMGAKVLPHDSLLDRSTYSKRCVIEESDIILVSVSADVSNKDYIDWPDLEKMKPSCCLVNISRWFIVNELSLLRFLESGLIRAALDVVSENSVLKAYRGDDLIITPHVAGSTVQSQQKACQYVLNKLGDELK